MLTGKQRVGRFIVCVGERYVWVKGFSETEGLYSTFFTNT